MSNPRVEAALDAALADLGWDWNAVPEEHVPSAREALRSTVVAALTAADAVPPAAAPGAETTGGA